ncbi:MAG TPA: hypothetical protein VFN50_00415 [Acidimicrobiales bacterium]|nr:hypothetical protein [Acidimicrobiales bacterium]
MDETQAAEEEGAAAATPIFSVYRRGYDPEQVDRYVADQQRRLDEALHRASESERKLAAAVGQLRELHRRVAVYESEARSAQPPALDTLGERVQRILQEAWEGAYNLRQEAEREVGEMRDHAQREVEALREQAEKDVLELREVASKEAADVVDEATRRALAIRDEMDRRRQAYLERVERDRQRSVSQLTYLYDQRQLAISELARLQATVEATIEEMVHSPLSKPIGAVADAAASRGPVDEETPSEPVAEEPGFVAEEAPLLSEASDEDEARPPTAQAETSEAPRHGGSLFDQIIGDPETADHPVNDEAADATAPWDTDRPEAATVDISEIPTGPMEALGYGYSYESPAAEETTLMETADPTSQPAPSEPRQYGGVYDAEADGWG